MKIGARTLKPRTSNFMPCVNKDNKEVPTKDKKVVRLKARGEVLSKEKTK